MSGKGDAYRPVDAAKYRAEWDRIFERGEQNAPDKRREVRGTTPGITPGEWTEFVDVPAPDPT